MRLKPPDVLMLGLVRLGAQSGYAIKKAADVSTHFFWPTSLAQVYPALARLERAGLLSSHDDPRGARTRHSHELTAEGDAALASWLNSESTETQMPQFRDEDLLRLFFADALEPHQQLALVERLHERARGASAHMREQIVPMAEALEQAERRYPAIVARLGADTCGYVEQWLATLETQLKADHAPPAKAA